MSIARCVRALSILLYLVLASWVPSWGQCDHQVDNVFFLCRPENPDSFYVAFRVFGDAGVWDVVDLNNGVADNSGFFADDISDEETPTAGNPVELTVSDSIEYRYFGPFPDGVTVNVVLVDTAGVCDSVWVINDAFTCSIRSGVCGDLPFYNLDYNINFIDSFLIIERQRIEGCSDSSCVAGNQKRCFEFRVVLPDNAVGIELTDAGSGSPGGELYYADETSPDVCFDLLNSNPGGNNMSSVCVPGGATYIAMSCKQGGNSTSAVVKAFFGPEVPSLETIEPCDLVLSVSNADSVSWSSPDDPTLANFDSCSADSTVCFFLYNDMVFGDVTACEGDTFMYVVAAQATENVCLTDTVIMDTSRVIVYPTYDVEIDSACTASTTDSLDLTAVITSPAAGCSYAIAWSTGETTGTITVLADGSQYSVTVTRADLDTALQGCVLAADTIVANSALSVDCSQLSDDSFQCPADVPPADTTLVVVTGCGQAPVIFVSDSGNGGTGCIGDTLFITRTYTVDADGDAMTTGDQQYCIQVFTIVDDTNPVLDPMTCPADTTLDCATGDPAALGRPTYTDNCTTPGEIALSMRDDTLSGFDGSCMGDTVGLVRRTWFGTDACGNVDSSCIQFIAYTDGTAPSMQCPADVTLVADAGCMANTDPAQTGSPSVSDDCGSVSLVFSDATSSDDPCIGSSVITRTWTATDACGNSTSCVQSITIQDNTPPGLVCPPDTTVDCTADTAPSGTGGPAVATDNCDPVPVVSFSDVAVLTGCNGTGTVMRTWTATDACGNATSCVQVITVQDTTPPVITFCPPDMTISCDAGTQPADTGGPAQATDNCGQPVQITYTDMTAPGACAQEGTITRTWIATDACGVQATCVQTITVIDDTSPVFTSCPPDVTISCDTSPDPGNTGGSATATDNCDAAPQVTYSDADDLSGCNGTGTITRAWVATDACGNTVACVQTITVEDLMPPVISCPADVTVSCEESTDPGQTGMATAMDACDGSPVVTSEDLGAPGSCNTTGSFIRRWYATDACGNIDSCDQMITVVDNTPPSAACQDITVDFDGMDQVSIAPEDVDNGSTDNCGGVTLALDQTMFSCEEVGNDPVTVTLTVTDACGLQSTCTASVSFINGANLMLSCPDTVFLEPEEGACEVEVIYDVVAEDNCGNTVVLMQTDGTGITVGDMVPIDTMFEQSYLAYNENGDTLACTFPVIVGGQFASGQMSCNAAINLSLGPDCKATITPHMLLMGDFQGCMDAFVVSPKDDSVTLINGNMVDESFAGQTIAVMVTNLQNGNACWTMVTVEDKLPPQLTCSSDTILCHEPDDPLTIGLPVNGGDVTTNPDGSLTVTGLGQCGPVTLTYFDEVDVPGCDGDFLRITYRNWTATDAAGNTSACTDTIYHLRTGLGAITLPGHFDGTDHPPLSCADACLLPSGAPSTTCTGEPGGAICDHIYIDYDDTTLPQCGGSYKVFRLWTVIDLCTGENLTHMQKIVIADDEGPAMTCPDTVYISTNGFDCNGAVLLAPPAVSDDCSDWTIDLIAPGISVTPQGDAYFLSGLSLGCHQVTWIARDECGNQTSCPQVICVQDEAEPIVVCDLHSTVTLTREVTEAIASAFTDNSYDACGGIFVTGRRMDSCIDFDWTTLGAGVDEEPNGAVTAEDAGTVHRSHIPFSCCDVSSGPVMIELRVTDLAGNANTCMVEVTVQDKFGPEISCAPDITVGCDFDIDLALLEDLADRTFGTVLDGDVYEDVDRLPVIVDGTNWGIDGIAHDLCQIDLSVSVADFREGCGLGVIQRVFTASDGVNEVSCLQTITVVNDDPFWINADDANDPTDDVIWPADITVEGSCAVDEETGGTPVLLNAGCDLVGASFSDLILPFDQFACAKVLRTWSVIDWCQYDPEALTGIWEHTQEIKIVNPQGPSGVLLNDQPVFCQNDPEVTYDPNGGCAADVILSLETQDDCTPSESLTWSYALDLWSDGLDLIMSDEYTGDAQGASLVGEQLVIPITLLDVPFNDPNDPDQTHTVIWMVRDQCGNTSEIPQLLRLEDCKLPTPVCLDLVAPFDSLGGMVTIPASAFNASSTDNCTPEEDLTYHFGTYGGGPEYTFTCTDVILNGSEVLNVDIVVTDAYGNTSSCVVELVLENGNALCGVTTASIAGQLATESGEVVAHSEVHLMDGSTMVDDVMTGTNGAYAFEDIPGGKYVVEPYKNDDVLNGVSTLDLIRIQKHLLGLVPFSSPFQYIAADVNNSAHVSAVDILALRKVLLGIDTAFTANQSWRFVPTSFDFADPTHPWPFDEVIQLDVHHDTLDADFTGIKIGDVNGSFVASATNVDTRSDQQVLLQVSDQFLHRGVPVRLVLRIAGVETIEGLQMVLEGEDLDFLDVEPLGLPITRAHLANSGSQLAISWHDDRPVDNEGALFAITVSAQRSAHLRDLLRLNGRRLTAELYSPDHSGWRIHPISLQIGRQEANDFALLQNVPNPWQRETTVLFELPAAMPATLEIFDVTGRLLWTRQISGHAGRNVVMLNDQTLTHRGLFYCRLEAGPFSAVRKMVRH